ncbi:EthD domain-containing protein [Streptomyces sp. NPDC006012]|uniref:EthD domain-containing protein n=1 Tax=Streptomyces sp. NPDC006012 TaxID=3364739 RepID=UPI0036BEE01B
MLKRLSYLKKRDDISTEAFIEYYENRHVPLILSLAPTPLVYKRHYLMRGDDGNLREEGVDFDVVTEMGWADPAEQLAWYAKIRAAADLVAADEARFLDRSSTRSLSVEQRVTAG